MPATCQPPKVAKVSCLGRVRHEGVSYGLYLGLPRGRSVDSIRSCLAVSAVQAPLP